jgi:hypothetical protein
MIVSNIIVCLFIARHSTRGCVTTYDFIIRGIVLLCQLSFKFLCARISRSAR